MRFPAPLLALFLLVLTSPLFFGVSGCLALTNLDGDKLPDDNVNDLPRDPELPVEPSPDIDVVDGGIFLTDGGGGEPDQNPSPDAEVDAGVAPEPSACTYWSDCPAGDDDNSGYECTGGQCVCDPNAVYQNNCQNLGGSWNLFDCLCTFPDDVEGSTCQIWQDCGTFSDVYQTGYECLNSVCTCDPVQQYQNACLSQGGNWLAGDCACSFAGAPPPGDAVPEGWIWDVEPECWWHLVEPLCDADRYVDTSYYREECYPDPNGGSDICRSVYVPDGYWEDGACPAPYWEPICYSVGTARWGVTG